MVNETKIDQVIKIAEVIEQEEIDSIIQTLSYVKLWLILFTLIVIKVIIFKVIKTCKKAYTVHNERVIRQHGVNQA